MRTVFGSLIAILLLAGGTPARAHLASGTVTLDVAEEVPPPTGASPNAGGTATFELEDDQTLTYQVTVHDLTGPALVGHIHEGAPGVAGPVIIPFTKLPDGTFMGTTGALTDDQVGKLLSGAYYANVHTATNLVGEVRGQIHLTVGAGTCSCKNQSRRDFLKCVRTTIAKLDKTTRRSAAARALKRAAKKSSCGLTQKKKTIACCLPPVSLGGSIPDVVAGKLCAPVKKDAQCTKLGGTSLGASSSCFPNPCVPPASPSGAFVD